MTEYQTSQIADLDNRLLCFWIPNVISVKRIEKDYFNTQTGNGAILSVGCLQFEETLMKITPISCPMTFKETKLLKEKKKTILFLKRTITFPGNGACFIALHKKKTTSLRQIIAKPRPFKVVNILRFRPSKRISDFIVEKKLMAIAKRSSFLMCHLRMMIFIKGLEIVSR